MVTSYVMMAAPMCNTGSIRVFELDAHVLKRLVFKALREEAAEN